MAQLRVQNLTKSFDRKVVLKDLNFDFEEREIVAILGPSGCGKSTLLRILAGLLKPDQGQLPFDPSDLQLSMVFQEASLLPWRTVSENISLPFELESRERPSAAQVQKILDLVSLSQSKDLFPDQLSGGMKMRVSLARAWVRQPGLFMMDEAFSSLDEVIREELQVLTRKFFQDTSGIQNIFCVTHSLQEAFFLADRILVMNSQGQIVESILPKLDLERNIEFRLSPEFQMELQKHSPRIRQILGARPSFL